MTKTFLICAFTAVAFTACEQKVDAPDLLAAPEVPALIVAEEKTVSAPPEPVKADPPPAAPEIAPPPAKPTVGSTVWAVTRISVTTDDGIIGVPPGSKLRVVKQSESGYVVTDEKQEFPVSEAQVSLSAGAGSNAAMSDAAARAAAAEWQRANAAGSRNSQVAMVNQVAGELQNRYDQLAREEAQLKAGLQRAHTEILEVSNARSQRRVFNRTISDGQVAAWKARLPLVQSEKDKVFWELKRTRQ